eukprot:Hpha_TRINITY_DN16474_c0_g3::TRINITY_DN16474_c0_g3_i1::g.160270::m.160270
MASLLIFVEQLGQRTAVELGPDATVADLAAAVESSPHKLRFQGRSFADPSGLLADLGVCQQSEVSILCHERWKPKTGEIMRQAVGKLAESEWRTTPEIEAWMSDHHSGVGAPNSFDIEDWDVSSVTDMCCMFRRASTFNNDISNWDVSSVTDMSDMFHGASSFNNDISKWDVSSVIDMSDMFHGASSFNNDI